MKDAWCSFSQFKEVERSDPPSGGPLPWGPQRVRLFTVAPYVIGRLRYPFLSWLAKPLGKSLIRRGKNETEETATRSGGEGIDVLNAPTSGNRWINCC